jgi:hypothetical protein
MIALKYKMCGGDIQVDTGEKISKQREDSLGTLVLKWDFQHMKFEEVSAGEEGQDDRVFDI